MTDTDTPGGIDIIERLTFEQWLEQVAAAIGHEITMSDLQLDRLRHWFEAGYSARTAARWIEEQ